MTDPVGFVGRQGELRILKERLAAAEMGHPQIVYLEGEAGAGKSTLLSRFLGSLSKTAVLEVGGDEDETLLSYGVVDQLQPGGITDPGTDPMAVGARLVDLLDRLQSDSEVVVLVIDDLQWVDRPSSRAVLFALRRLRADKVLTIVSSRVGQLVDPGWARFLGGDPRVTRVRLGGLSASDLIELASALGMGTLSLRGAVRLAAHTEGNALYCRALLDEIGIAGLNGGDSPPCSSGTLCGDSLPCGGALGCSASILGGSVGTGASCVRVDNRFGRPIARRPGGDRCGSGGRPTERKRFGIGAHLYPSVVSGRHLRRPESNQPTSAACACRRVRRRSPWTDPSSCGVAWSGRGIGPRVRGIRSSQCRTWRTGGFSLGLRCSKISALH